jgi:hypothetical protein
MHTSILPGSQEGDFVSRARLEAKPETTPATKAEQLQSTLEETLPDIDVSSFKPMDTTEQSELIARLTRTLSLSTNPLEVRLSVAIARPSITISQFQEARAAVKELGIDLPATQAINIERILCSKVATSLQTRSVEEIISTATEAMTNVIESQCNMLAPSQKYLTAQVDMYQAAFQTSFTSAEDIEHFEAQLQDQGIALRSDFEEKNRTFLKEMEVHLGELTKQSSALTTLQEDLENKLSTSISSPEKAEIKKQLAQIKYAQKALNKSKAAFNAKAALQESATSTKTVAEGKLHLLKANARQKLSLLKQKFQLQQEIEDLKKQRTILGGARRKRLKSEAKLKAIEKQLDQVRDTSTEIKERDPASKTGRKLRRLGFNIAKKLGLAKRSQLLELRTQRAEIKKELATRERDLELKEGSDQKTTEKLTHKIKSLRKELAAIDAKLQGCPSREDIETLAQEVKSELSEPPKPLSPSAARDAHSDMSTRFGWGEKAMNEALSSPENWHEMTSVVIKVSDSGTMHGSVNILKPLGVEEGGIPAGLRSTKNLHPANLQKATSYLVSEFGKPERSTVSSTFRGAQLPSASAAMEALVLMAEEGATEMFDIALLTPVGGLGTLIKADKALLKSHKENHSCPVKIK